MILLLTLSINSLGRKNHMVSTELMDLVLHSSTIYMSE